MLRRYFAVTRWKASWPLELISQALGHKHLDTTVQYLGILDDKLMEASREFYEKEFQKVWDWKDRIERRSDGTCQPSSFVSLEQEEERTLLQKQLEVELAGVQ